MANQSADYRLQDAQVDIWGCNGDDFQNESESYFLLLSDEEKLRAKRFKFEKHRQRFIIFHGFMRIILARYLNINPEKVQYNKGDNGKPYLLDSDLYFNLSHTQSMALLAVSKGTEVGIDIEFKERKTDWQGVGKRFFSDIEQQSLFSRDINQQENYFYSLWTRKEAYMKVLGTGLSLAPANFSLTVPPEPPALIEHYCTKIAPPESVSFMDVVLPEGLQSYCATLASNGVLDGYRYQHFFSN